MKLNFVSTNEKRAINIPWGKLSRNWREQFKCKFFLRLHVLKILNCLNWCYVNFSSDVHWQGTAHSFLSLLWFPMEWQKQGIGYRRASHTAVPPYSFPTILCYEVILTEHCLTKMEKFHSLSLKIQNIIKYICYFCQ